MTLVLDPRPLCKDLTQLAKELVPPDVFKARGVNALISMDERIIKALIVLRKLTGKPITINSWSWGGQFSQRGLRTAEFYGNIDKYLQTMSQHKYGRGLDFDVKGMTPHEVRKVIIENRYKFPDISFIEVGINWVHIDCRLRLDNDWCKFWHPKEGFLSQEEVLERGL